MKYNKPQLAIHPTRPILSPYHNHLPPPSPLPPAPELLPTPYSKKKQFITITLPPPPFSVTQEQPATYDTPLTRDTSKETSREHDAAL